MGNLEKLTTRRLCSLKEAFRHGFEEVS